MTRPRDMTDYTLVHDQSKLAIFPNACDVFGKEALGTSFQEQECKLTIAMCMLLAALCSERPKRRTKTKKLAGLSSVSQFRLHHDIILLSLGHVYS